MRVFHRCLLCVLIRQEVHTQRHAHMRAPHEIGCFSDTALVTGLVLLIPTDWSP